MANLPQRPWFVNNWGFPEGMYYLGNTALRTSPPNSTQIFSLYIFMTTSKITLLHYYIYMIYMYKIAIPPQERPWFVNNGWFPEGMYYLENTALRTSPPNSNQIFFIYIYILKDSRFGILYKSKKISA